MRFEDQIAQLGDLTRPLIHHELRVLANLEPESLKVFWQIWRDIPAERRGAILRDLDGLAEDNIDLDFRPVLRACLYDRDAEVRVAAINGLWEDESEATMDRLIALIADVSGPVRAAAVVGLAPFAYRGEMGELSAPATQRVYQALLAAATDDAQPLEVRRRAVEGLGYFAASPEAQAEIGHAYAHHELAVRESALRAMGRSMLPRWFPIIERELKSPAPALRYEAARAVGELGAEGEPFLPMLLPLIDDEDGEIATTAIWALGQVGSASAKRVLQRLARSKDEARRMAATEALEEIDL